MTERPFFAEFFEELTARLCDAPTADLDRLCQILGDAKGRKVIVAGNGGSAAIASHVSVDLTKAAGIRAVSFNDADLITCFGNDYGYENWMAKAIDHYADPGDTAVFISSSGQSRNVVNGARRAAERQVTVVTLSGFQPDNPLRSAGDLNLWVNSRNYNIVETTHQSWLVAAVDKLAGTKVRP